MARTSTHAVLALLGAMAFARPSAAQHAPQRIDTVHVVARTDPTVVSATRSFEVLTRADLARHATRSLAEVLGLALGVDAQPRSPAQADLGLRGSTFNQVVVLVDGVRVSDVQSGHYALDLAVPVAMIERIEILRGTGSAMYGSDAIGGVVNIVTRADSSFGELAMRAGSFGGALGQGAVGGVVHGTPLRVGADVDRSSGHRDDTDYRVVQARAAGERRIGAARVSADAAIGARQFGAADFYSPYPSYETTRSSTATVRGSAPLTERVTITGALHTRRHSDVFTLKREDPAFYQNVHHSWQHGAEGTAQLALAPRLRAAFGAELLDARLRSARLGDHSERRSAEFVEATLGRAGGASLDAGLRHDWSSAVGSFVSPSLGIAVPLPARAQLRASASRGFRAPTWTERYYKDPSNVADSTLSVERFEAYEIGVRVVPLARLSADVALFERHAHSLIDWARSATAATPPPPWRTMNFASATYRGVEALMQATDVAGVDWTMRASGLRFDASVEPGTVGKYALRPLTRVVGLSATTHELRGASLTVDAQRARRAFEDDHLRLDARVDQRIRAMRLSVELLNLTNEDYLDVSGKPVAGRSAFVGLAWSAR
ncbi:MAG: TonB-dependent receptor [Gemmatimonadaceae bacterium]